jgi:hypothetical protein
MMKRQLQTNLKGRVRHELRAYLIITLFFTLILGVFNVFRRLILGEAGVSASNYGISLVEALILAKIVLIGDAMNLKLIGGAGRSIFELAFLRSFLFAVLVWLFTILEHVVEGLIRRLDWSEIGHSIVRHGLHEMVARIIMMFAAFLPFFALWELRLRLGPRRFFELWFSRNVS